MDADAIYTYALSVDHGICGDSWPSAQTSSSVTAVYLAGFEEPDNQEIIVEYSLSTNVGKGKLKALLEGENGGDFEEVGSVDLTADELTVGPHKKRFWIRRPRGTHRRLDVVFIGSEDDEAADNNRGGLKKPTPIIGTGGDPIELAPSVYWEPAYEGQLDANPGPGGGQRIFPDASSEGGAARPKVNVMVQLNHPMAGVTVYLKSFDVDDPSSSSAPLDNENESIDNRGGPAEGALKADRVTTDENGKATTEFTVSMKPGDNYRVVATIRQNWLTGLRTRHPDANSYVYDMDDDPVSAPQITSLLTVWRKLHVEVDSMGAPIVGKEVTGKVLAVGAGGQAGRYAVTTNQSLDDSVDRFVGGHFKYGGVDCNNITGNTVGTHFVVEIIPPAEAPLPTVNQDFTLTDDDVFPDDVPDPDLSVATSELARAFIVVLDDAGTRNPNAPYLPNIPWGEGAYEAVAQPVRQCSSSEAYWAVQTFGCFQGDKRYDADPDSEIAHGGIATGRTAFVFTETMRDIGNQDFGPSHAIAHEIGHCFYLPHSASGLMKANDPVGGFSNDSLDLIRKCTDAPGSRDYAVR